MQNNLSIGKLLNEQGNLCEAGYAKSLVKEYNRNDIKANKLRIKEWDYYYIGNNDYGIALTIADNSYMGLSSVSLLDFRTGYQMTKSVMTWFTKGKTNLPASSVKGDVFFKNKKLTLEFFNNGDKRVIHCEMPNFDNNQTFKCDVILYDTPDESMVIATPFNKNRHFYYNQKINCLRVKGSAFLGNTEYLLNDAYAVLDWGRGVWTYKNTWYWSSLSTCIDDKRVGFNLGYGFGDTTKATENMLFYDGKAYKINQVTFNIPKDNNGKDDFLKPWTFTSNDDSVKLDFIPVIDRYSNTNALVIQSLQHQVFGKFNGFIKIDNKIIEIRDKIGFAEKVMNKW